MARGPRRRKGCETCKKRKIKCDERRPVCLHCASSRRKCHGWAKDIEFVPQQKVPTAQQLPLHRLVFKAPISSFSRHKRGTRPGSNGKRPSGQRDPTLPDPDSSSESSHDSKSLDLCYSGVLLSPSSRLAEGLVRLLNTGVANGSTVLYFGEYFEGVPAYLGRSDCLDAAVEYLLLSQQRSQCPLTADSSQHLKAHGRALRLLHQQLSCPNEVTRVETLCSALILYSSEVFDISSKEHAHFAHADGAIALLRAYGPRCLKSRFELQLFYAHVPTIVFKALLSHSNCFIDRPDWKRVQENIPEAWLHDRLEARILHTYARLPAIFNNIRDSGSVRGEGIPQCTIIEAASLKQELHQLNQLVECLLLSPDSWLETSTRSMDRCPSSQYHWLDDVRLTEALGIFWRTVILATRAFNHLCFAQPTDWTFAGTAARRLCMLVQHVQMLNPNGLVFAVFNLRVARIACPEVLRAWIDTVLPRIEGAMTTALLDLVHLFDTALDIQPQIEQCLDVNGHPG